MMCVLLINAADAAAVVVAVNIDDAVALLAGISLYIQTLCVIV